MASKHINFTVQALKALPPAGPGQRDVYHDAREQGLQLRVGATGEKHFSLFVRVKNGPPVRISLGRFPDQTIEQVRRRALQLKSELAQGRNPAEALRARRDEMTLGQAFESYLEHHAAPLNLKTQDAMRGNFERYLGALPTTPPKKHGKQRVKSKGAVNWQNRKLSMIKPANVVQLRAALAKGAGKAAANHALKLVRTVFAHVIRLKLFDGDNPAAGLGILKIPSRDRFLQQEELPRLFQALAQASNADTRDFVLLSLLTGARKSNLLAMAWNHIDLVRREWYIPDTKNGEPLVVQLPEAAIKILVNRPHSGPWVFPGSGKTGHMVSPKKAVSSLFRQAGINGLCIHDLRRTLGSWQAITGASLAIIGKSLGHKSVQATQVYARLSADPVRASVERAVSAIIEAGTTSISTTSARSSPEMKEATTAQLGLCRKTSDQHPEISAFQND
jgi:integrase